MWNARTHALIGDSPELSRSPAYDASTDDLVFIGSAHVIPTCRGATLPACDSLLGSATSAVSTELSDDDSVSSAGGSYDEDDVTDNEDEDDTDHLSCEGDGYDESDEDFDELRHDTDGVQAKYREACMEQGAAGDAAGDYSAETPSIGVFRSRSTDDVMSDFRRDNTLTTFGGSASERNLSSVSTLGGMHVQGEHRSIAMVSNYSMLSQTTFDCASSGMTDASSASREGMGYIDPSTPVELKHPFHGMVQAQGGGCSSSEAGGNTRSYKEAHGQSSPRKSPVDTGVAVSLVRFLRAATGESEARLHRWAGRMPAEEQASLELMLRVIA